MNKDLIIQNPEIQVINNKGGLVAIASCVLNDSLYLGSIGIYNRPCGGYRLTYPTKKLGDQSINIYNPINRQLGNAFEEILINKYLDILKGGGGYA